MIFTQPLISQEGDSSIVDLFKEYVKRDYPEQVYVHLDRNYYLVGERIWFSVYCLEQDSHRPSAASAVAYVELLDRQGEALVQNKIELTEGLGNGYLDIPMFCRSEEHIIRCYTKWQRNFGPLHYHYTKVLIIHPSGSYKQPETRNKTDEVRINLFPEGGKLTEGVLNHIVFTITDPYMQPLEGALTVISEDSLLHVEASTIRPGIGTFYLLPEKGISYQLIASGPGLMREVHKEIPEARKYACALELKSRPSGFHLILRPGMDVVRQNGKLSAMVWTKTGIQYFSELEMDSLILLDIRKDRPLAGVNFLTIFDEQNRILAERVFYTGDTNPLEVSTPGLKESYQPRDSIEFSLETSSPAGYPVTALSSLSVSMSGTSVWQSASNSLAGNLHWGGASSSSLPEEDLYAIANSQGSCFWLLEASAEPIYPPEMEGLMVSGVIQNKISREPVKDELIVLALIDSFPDLFTSSSDEEGRFHFSLNPMHGKREMIVQPVNTSNDYIITLDDEFTNDPLPDMGYAFSDQDSLPGLFEELLLNQQLAEAYSTSGVPLPESNYQGHTFYGVADQQIHMKDFIRLPVLEEVFRELGKRVYLGRQGNSYKVSLLDLETNRIIGENPMYLMDGIPFFSSEDLLSINPSEISSIHFKSEKYFLNDLRMDGIIDVRSNNGRAELIGFPRSAVREYFQGFQQEGYFPSSGEEYLQDPRVPLFKSTLYFNPGILTSPLYESKVSFIAPDRKGAYEVVIKVFGRNGRLAEQVQTFVVE